MTLNEIFEVDREAGVPLDFPELVVSVSEELLRSTCRDLNEGRWTPSHASGLYQLIDPVRPEIEQRRHGHVAAKKDLSTLGKQVAWNDDGSCPNRHKFNAARGQRKDCSSVARAALRLGDDVNLEHITGDKRAGATLVRLYDHLVGPSGHEQVFLKVK